MKIFTVNPGSTSTKVALIEDDKVLFSQTVSHDASKLAEFESIPDQLPYRINAIHQVLSENGISLDDIDAVAGRCGSLLSMEGGVYEVTDLVLHDSITAVNGVFHPAMLGATIAHTFAEEYGKPAFIVNPPEVDEFQDLARMTGVKGIYRYCHLHALNLKETAIRHAHSIGRAYEDCNFVVCHMGGGISISAHRKGRMIDGFNIVGGEGPMSPTRCGSLSVTNILQYLEDHSVSELKKLTSTEGGFVSHLGISDSVELTDRAAAGDRYAQMLWDTMIYQVIKGIGSMAATLNGDIDGILLGGGLVYSEDLVNQITDACSWIAPVTAYPGEFEMEAMAAGVSRVFNGEEQLKVYSGVPNWNGFDF